MSIIRQPTGRGALHLRPLVIQPNVNRYAEGSVLIQAGNTHVLCTASVEDSVPPWLKGKGQGWVTAEYSMLPRATHTRSKRDREKVSGRTQEIQRLIGRALRSVVKMEALGERSILIDCDVLQADGGTRTASISGSFVALAIALQNVSKKLALDPRAVLRDSVSAISVGLKGSEVLVDLDYEEDSSCDVDMNFVMTGQKRFVEVQGTAERDPFSEEELMKMTEGAKQALVSIREAQLKTLAGLGITL